MIIATAGHVDHGKTSLVKALTGVDTDRLPEEKKRSLTIDLGFAYLPAGDTKTIGFIDVPGHERFVRNALCGLAGADYVLFIIAADDGPMPQTAEHLAIIDLLGISNGAIALTKIDRVAPERVTAATEEIAVLFLGTTLETAPVFPVSATTGDGILDLRQHLQAVAPSIHPRPASGRFRLAIDRRFDVVGAGLIVTGTAFAGTVSAGDTLKVLGQDMTVRVRGLHAQNKQASTGVAGQRCALNLSGPGLQKDRITRGDWITALQAAPPSIKFDCEVTVLASEAKSLAHWTPLHIHLGAAETSGRIAILEDKAIAPGNRGLAQLVLDHPIGAVHGDRLILRDQSARRTIGGGRVLDIFPPRRGRARPERLTWLQAQKESEPARALAILLEASPNGIALSSFSANRNLTDDQLDQAIAALKLQIVPLPDERFAFSPAHWKDLGKKVTERLAKWHKTTPSVQGLGEAQVFAGIGLKLSNALATAICTELVREGALIREGLGVRLPTHSARFEGADEDLWRKIEASMKSAFPRPMTARELVAELGGDLRKLESFLLRAGRHNLIVRLSKTRFATPALLAHLAHIAETVAADADDGLLSVKSYRDASGIGRNLVIEILEFFDQQRFTHRHGEGRRILQPAEKLFGVPPVKS